jgi:superfamily I DNA/RNA helicase
MQNNLITVITQNTGKGFVLAPAGFGKTYLISEAVRAGEGRQLILTHTHAGVNSLKNKMKELNVSSSMYQIETIASWSMLACNNYPSTTNWKPTNEPTKAQWVSLYPSLIKLLSKEFFKEVFSNSYSRMYVDEYQDCSTLQHELILKMGSLIPTVIVGDPLQTIFDFKDTPVYWQNDIVPNFINLGELKIPYRWYNANSHALGDWLLKIRQTILKGERIDLQQESPSEVKIILTNRDGIQREQVKTILYPEKKPSINETTIALHSGQPKYKAKTHKLAQLSSGKFSSMEEIEGKELQKFIRKISKAATSKEQFLCLIEFLAKSHTKVKISLSAPTKRGDRAKIGKTTKHPELTANSNNLITEFSAQNAMNFINSLCAITGVHRYRKDLIQRLINVLQIMLKDPILNLEAAYSQHKLAFKFTGSRDNIKNQISTTLLTKGLEYDHAVILEACSLKPKELYVALTRGSKTLTIISTTRYLQT